MGGLVAVGRNVNLGGLPRVEESGDRLWEEPILD